MNPGKAPVCKPTWRGHVETTRDALLVFEACFNGTLAHCFRRPHDRERNSLIVSGNVFVYEEGTSGIKRWTDGIPWSPSRILTNFLIYRQLNSPFPPGEKKRATKRSQRPIRPGEPYAAPLSASSSEKSVHSTDRSGVAPGFRSEDGGEKDVERTLVGSLIDSYDFKEQGLLKKTMTVVVNNVQHHLVSYYSLDDAKYRLKTPREDPRLKDQPLREELLQQPRFKFPNLDDAGDGIMEMSESATSGLNYLPQINTMSSYLYPHSAQLSPQDPSPHAYYSNIGAFATHSTSPSPFTHYPISLVSSVSQASFPPTPTPFSPQQTPKTSQQSFKQEQQQFQSPALYKTQRTLSLPIQVPTPRYHSLPQYTPTSSTAPVSHDQSLPTKYAASRLPRPDGLSNLTVPLTDYGSYQGFYAPTANLPTSLADLPLAPPPQWHNPFQSSYAAHTDVPSYSYRAAS